MPRRVDVHFSASSETCEGRRSGRTPNIALEVHDFRWKTAMALCATPTFVPTFGAGVSGSSWTHLGYHFDIGLYFAQPLAIDPR